ncbi:hypothetical protein L195_g023393 [Trifolium pratense]|uniref:Uncharacterized protein n=1 Tax=Trifolium pratense TaxID=57577 RepID=A0A2K3NAR0_TRIPR|nr:hypothetical protein L195_g023393 [Trifolium pratense]
MIKRIAGHKAIDSDQAKEVIITELKDKVEELLRALIIQTVETIDLVKKKTKKSMDERKRHKKIITALKDLKEKNTYLKKDISTLEQENTALEEENTALKEENNSAKRDISTLKQENTALMEENNSAKRDNTYLKEQVEGGNAFLLQKFLSIFLKVTSTAMASWPCRISVYPQLDAARSLLLSTPGFNVTNAHGDSPHFSSGLATTDVSSIAGCEYRAFSNFYISIWMLYSKITGMYMTPCLAWSRARDSCGNMPERTKGGGAAAAVFTCTTFKVEEVWFPQLHKKESLCTWQWLLHILPQEPKMRVLIA